MSIGLFKTLLNNDNTGFIDQNKSFLIAMIKVFDSIIIIYLYFIYFELDSNILEKNRLLILLVAVLSFQFFATLNNLYNIPKGSRFLFVVKDVFSAWLNASFVIMLTLILTKYIIDKKILVLYWIVLTPFYIICWRLILRVVLNYLRITRNNSRRVAIAGATNLGVDLEKIITSQAWMGFSFVGYYDDRTSLGSERAINVDLVGNFDEMIDKAKNNQLDVIFITLPMISEKRIKNILDKLSDTTVVVYFMPNMFVFDLLGAKIENFNGLPAICVYDTPIIGVDGFSKRAFDLVVVLLILIIISIPMLIIATGVKLSSPGPVIFFQRRYGFRGEEFFVWKFRTMLVCEDGNNISQATQNDPRITKFGQFLRRTSLDEFPQFFNVLQGRMSLVGPRPHAIAHNELYRGQIKGYMLRHNVKPGITGLAQVRGFRGETDTLGKMEDRIHSDLEYIQNWSLWLDIEIMFYTIFYGFKHKNAY